MQFDKRELKEILNQMRKDKKIARETPAYAKTHASMFDPYINEIMFCKTIGFSLSETICFLKYHGTPRLKRSPATSTLSRFINKIESCREFQI